ncbi:hypothetical protein ES332_A06G071300v1 [Gossypium tomentosum]|uniref:Uncharacterized protein n=1 Tax=Gossypium tomentosum TaxID=34277 RepID=A0A5D2Q1G0_GOSTO|nr:hypothetical protein ES332_A06G071300v1 [Gossypium tomentosum]
MVVCRFMSSCPNSFWVLISPRAHLAMLITRTNLLLPCIPTKMNFWPPCARSHPPPLLALALLHYPFMAGFEGHKRECFLFCSSVWITAMHSPTDNGYKQDLNYDKY